MEIPLPTKMTIALTLTSTPPQSSPLTSPIRHEIFPISQYPAEKTDPVIETQVLSSYATWLQQEIRRLQSRVEEQVEKREQLNKRLSYITQNFETEVRRGVVEELSKEYRKSTSDRKTPTFSGFDCMSLNDDDFSGSRIKKKSESCSFLYEELYEKKRGCLAYPPAVTALSTSSTTSSSTPASPRRRLRSSYSHPHKVRFSQHDTVVLFQPDEDRRTFSSGDDCRLDTFSMSDDDVVPSPSPLSRVTPSGSENDIEDNGDDLSCYDSSLVSELRSNNSSGEISYTPPRTTSQQSSLVITAKPDQRQTQHVPVAVPEPHYFTLEELTQIAKREGLI
eukprot:TRINITY_DN7344_c0_g1_i1.p1 TRINITY_DN7344_c0_g1~~TRINITY_DN7344_c0_g1_i1.p1  ORF type:complete len:335 (-),score=65.38 TRINITY_DN7344_c0_g1_i1:362-1366(-)